MHLISNHVSEHEFKLLNIPHHEMLRLTEYYDITLEQTLECTNAIILPKTHQHY